MYQPGLALLGRSLDETWFDGYVFAWLARSHILTISHELGTTEDKIEPS